MINILSNTEVNMNMLPLNPILKHSFKSAQERENLLNPNDLQINHQNNNYFHLIN